MFTCAPIRCSWICLGACGSLTSNTRTLPSMKVSTNSVLSSALRLISTGSGMSDGLPMSATALACHSPPGTSSISQIFEVSAVVVLCQEGAQASCCARDGGTGAALQEEASNCHELLRPKSAVVNVMVKRRGCDRVMYGSGRRAQANLR